MTLFYIFDARSVVWFGRIVFLDNDVARGLGIALSTVGLLVGIAGEVTLGESFRVALPREETRLVTTGIYRYIRNPCALGADLFALGTLFIAPSLLALAAAVLNLYSRCSCYLRTRLALQWCDPGVGRGEFCSRRIPKF